MQRLRPQSPGRVRRQAPEQDLPHDPRGAPARSRPHGPDLPGGPLGSSAQKGARRRPSEHRR